MLFCLFVSDIYTVFLSSPLTINQVNQDMYLSVFLALSFYPSKNKLSHCLFRFLLRSPNCFMCSFLTSFRLYYVTKKVYYSSPDSLILNQIRFHLKVDFATTIFVSFPLLCTFASSIGTIDAV